MSRENCEKTALTDEEFCRVSLDANNWDNQEAEAFKDAIASYRSEALVWAERRSAAMPSLSTAAKRNNWLTVPQWSMAAIAVIAIAAGALQYTSRHDTAEVTAPALTRDVLPTSTQQQIADDNELLQSIDAAVNSGVSLPVNALGLDESTNHEATHGSVE